MVKMSYKRFFGHPIQSKSVTKEEKDTQRGTKKKSTDRNQCILLAVLQVKESIWCVDCWMCGCAWVCVGIVCVCVCVPNRGFEPIRWKIVEPVQCIHPLFVAVPYVLMIYFFVLSPVCAIVRTVKRQERTRANKRTEPKWSYMILFHFANRLSGSLSHRNK